MKTIAISKKTYAIGAIALALLFTGSTVAFAQSPASTKIRTMIKGETQQTLMNRLDEPVTKLPTDNQINFVSSKLGLNGTEVKQELQAGKTPMEILTEHNITLDQAKTMLAGTFSKFRQNRNAMKLAITEVSPHILQAQASVLGITTDQLTASIKNGQRPVTLAKANGLTAKEFRTQVITQLQTMVTNGTVTGTDATNLSNYIQRAEQRMAKMESAAASK